MSDAGNERSSIISVRTATFVILLAFLLGVGRDAMFRDPGTLWHTVVGDRIIERGEVPMVDEFSFTRNGQRWIASQWLGECAMSVVHRAAGLDGLLLLAAAVLAATYAGIAERLRRAGLSIIGCALMVALVIAASSYHFNVRPHLAGIAFMALTFGLLCDVEAGRKYRGGLFLLILFLGVWGNIHGSSLGGAVTCVAAILGWTVVLCRDRDWPLGTTKWLFQFFTVLCLILTSQITASNGSRNVDMAFRLMTSTVVPQLIQEHGPPDWGSIEGVAILLLAAVYLVVLWSARKSMLRVTWFIPFVWLILAGSRVRHGPLFAVTAAIAIAEMLPYVRIGDLFSKFGGLLLCGRPHSPEIASAHTKAPGTLLGLSGRGRVPALNAAICAGVCVLIFSLQATGVRVPLVGAGWARLDPGYWPVEATDALAKRIKNEPEPARVFNQMTYGGYLIYKLPQARVFIDDRCELYGDEFLLRYDRVTREPLGMDTLADSEDIRYALVSSRSEMAVYLKASPHWRVLHEDATAILAEHLRPSRRVIIHAPDLHTPGPLRDTD